MHGIHSVFPLPQISGNNGQEPISKNKLESGKGQWEVRKMVLGFIVDGATRCIELAWGKKIVIDAELHTIVCMTKGVLFKWVKKLIWKNQICSNISLKGKEFDDVG